MEYILCSLCDGDSVCSRQAGRQAITLRTYRVWLSQVPRFTSEDDVLSPAELEMVHTHMANHKAYLDAGFVRKVSGRWGKLYQNQHGGGEGSSSKGSLIHLDVDKSGLPGGKSDFPADNKWNPIARARPHSQWGHNLGASGRAISPMGGNMPSRPQTSVMNDMSLVDMSGGSGLQSMRPQSSLASMGSIGSIGGRSGGGDRPQSVAYNSSRAGGLGAPSSREYVSLTGAPKGRSKRTVRLQ